MKSIYLSDSIHNSLKLLSALQKRSLTQLVEDLLKKGVKKQLSDLPAKVVAKLAQAGGSFDFLNNPEEDQYSDRDGSPVKR